MLNLSLKESQLIAENRGIKGYESMSKDAQVCLLQQNQSKKVKRILMTQNQQEIKIMMQMKYGKQASLIQQKQKQKKINPLLEK